MNPQKWNSSHWRNAGIISIIVLIAFIKLFVFIPVFDILNPSLCYIIPILILILSTILFIGWALKNKSHWAAFWRTIGILLVGAGFVFLWYALWHTTASLPLGWSIEPIIIGYAVTTCLCFCMAVLPIGDNKW